MIVERLTSEYCPHFQLILAILFSIIYNHESSNDSGDKSGQNEQFWSFILYFQLKQTENPVT